MKKLFLLLFLVGCQTTDKTIETANQLILRCDDAEELSTYLETRYKEVPKYAGILNQYNTVMILYVSKNQTWTIVHTLAGKACIVSSGTNWNKVNWREYKKI